MIKEDRVLYLTEMNPTMFHLNTYLVKRQHVSGEWRASLFPNIPDRDDSTLRVSRRPAAADILHSLVPSK